MVRGVDSDVQTIQRRALTFNDLVRLAWRLTCEVKVLCTRTKVFREAVREVVSMSIRALHECYDERLVNPVEVERESSAFQIGRTLR